MAWREPLALKTYREQLNAAFPKRSKISDGGIGDAAHASRNSDHNPWVKDKKGVGVFTARDITHDPVTGVDCHWLAEELRRHKDPRLKYVIWHDRMFSSYPAHGYKAWEWRPYSGSNKHRKHLHLSIQPTNFDDTRPWKLEFPKPRPLMDVATITREEEDLPEFPTVAEGTNVTDCPECNLAFDSSLKRFADDLCPDCGAKADAAKAAPATGETKTATGEKFDAPQTDVQPTQLKGWQTGLVGFVLTNLAAVGAWFTNQPPLVRASIMVAGAIATSALILAVVWIKNQREERANQKDVAIIKTKGGSHV
jgi:hypothetical protein